MVKSKIPGLAYHITRQGLVINNQPKSAFKGYCVKPMYHKAMNTWVYRLRVDGKYRKYKAEQLYRLAFPKVKVIPKFDLAWGEKMLPEIQRYNKKFSEKYKKSYKFKQEKNTEKKRRCHDCGKPTNNYRCSECWAKLRKEYGVEGISEIYDESYRVRIYGWR